MSIQILRGPSSRLNTITPGTGEPLWVTDTFEFRVGDGTTVGGVPLSFVKTFGSVTQDQVVLWESTDNIKGQDKATFLSGYATETYVDNGLAGKLDTTGKAADSFAADNADQLGGQLPSFYLDQNDISNSVTSTSQSTVASSLAVKTANDNANSKFDSGDLTSSISNPSTTTPLAAAAANTLNSIKLEDDDYATSTVGGTLKVRLSGTDLFITNNGSNA